MRQPKTIIVTIPGMIDEVDLIPLRDLSDVDYFEFSSIGEEELAEKCEGYDYLMLNMDVLPKKDNVKLTANFYAHPNIRSLKSIAVDMTGVDYFSPNAAAAAGVMLQNIPYYSSQSVAESILSEVLLHSRQRHLAYMDAIRQESVSDRKGINLQGRIAGIVGYGSIGSTTAKLLACLGMRVLVWNRSLKEGVNISSLEEIFSTSDVICITMKTVTEGAEANVNMIDSKILELCKGAIIVNLANESLIESLAMKDALQNGRVSAYSVEASSRVRDELNNNLNVHFAPHNAWNSDESMQTLRDVWVSNIISNIKGQPVNVYEQS